MHIKNPQLLLDIFQAYEDARKHKRKTRGVMEFSLNYEERLFKLYEELRNRTYTIAPSTCFIVEKPVRREIFAGDFRDRIVHHLVFNYINEFCERQFINDSYACRKSRGTSYGIRRLDHFIRSVSQNYTKDCYVLQLDISGFFMSIDKHILYKKVIAIVDRYKGEIACDISLLKWLIKMIIFHNHTRNHIMRGKISDWADLPKSKSLFYTKKNCGLPIGNLTSQLFANIYLNDFDHYAMKQALDLRYGRYVDDMFFIHNDPAFLKTVIYTVKNSLSDELNLKVHPRKIKLRKYQYGVNFLGAKLYRGRAYPDKRLIKNLKENIKFWNTVVVTSSLSKEDVTTFKASFNSYLGYVKSFQTRNLRKSILRKLDNSLESHINIS